MAKKKAEFPNDVYVRRDWDGSDPYFVAEDDIGEHADLKGDTRVAVYKLVEVVTVKVKIETKR